jgi:hypothetical protein
MVTLVSSLNVPRKNHSELPNEKEDVAERIK